MYHVFTLKKEGSVPFGRNHALFKLCWLCILICMFCFSCVTPGVDQDAPTIKIHKPARFQGLSDSKEEIYTSENKIQFSGIVGGESKIKSFRILTEGEARKIDKKTNFKENIILKPNLNTIVLEVVDQYGHKAERTFKVVFKDRHPMEYVEDAIEYLDKGYEEEAKEELQAARVAMKSRNPNEYRRAKRLADLLTRQIELDPISFFGVGQANYEYTVQKDDTLSKLSITHLNEKHKFYALAKYNNIPNPSKIQEGDIIRIPGKVKISDSIIMPGVRKIAAPNPSPFGPQLNLVRPKWLCKRGINFVPRGDNVQIVGYYKAKPGVKRVFLNNREINIDEEGRFRHSINLSQKETTLELYAVDRRGKESKRCVTKIRTELSKHAKPLLKRSGNYYALVIGNDDYLFWPDLKAPSYDAKAVARILSEYYGFQLIPPLFDKTRGEILLNATYEEIIDTLYQARRELNRDDHLLIYYAGHGSIDNGTAYWVPVDGKKHPGQWIDLDRIIRDVVKTMNAKHVLMISDSCFAGVTAMTPPKLPPPGERREQKLRDVGRKRSRTVLVSAEGAKETPDYLGVDRHSPFAQTFINVLDRQGDLLLGEELFGYLRQGMQGYPELRYNDLKPGYKAIRGAGHEDGGDFIFIPQRPAPM